MSTRTKLWPFSQDICEATNATNQKRCKFRALWLVDGIKLCGIHNYHHYQREAAGTD